MPDDCLDMSCLNHHHAGANQTCSCWPATWKTSCVHFWCFKWHLGVAALIWIVSQRCETSEGHQVGSGSSLDAEIPKPHGPPAAEASPGADRTWCTSHGRTAGNCWISPELLRKKKWNPYRLFMVPTNLWELCLVDGFCYELLTGWESSVCQSSLWWIQGYWQSSSWLFNHRIWRKALARGSLCNPVPAGQKSCLGLSPMMIGWITFDHGSHYSTLIWNGSWLSIIVW